MRPVRLRIYRRKWESMLRCLIGEHIRIKKLRQAVCLLTFVSLLATTAMLVTSSKTEKAPALHKIYKRQSLLKANKRIPPRHNRTTEKNGTRIFPRFHPIFKRPVKKRQIAVNKTEQDVSPCSTIQSTKEKKIILLWYKPFDDVGMVPENLFIGRLPRNPYSITWKSPDCGYCKITYDAGLLNESDAVVFHAFYPNETNPPPPKSHAEQKYIWWSQESDRNVPYDEKIRKYFDWTMTSSPDSHVFSPYATFAWILKFLWQKERGFDIMSKLLKVKGLHRASEEELQYYMDRYFQSNRVQRKVSQVDVRIKKLLSKKARLVSWIASNCRTEGSMRRLEVVDMMRRHGLHIDRFGTCSGAWFGISRWDPAFYEILSRYKFYLSFENSVHCRGYMTEKLWFSALYSGTVPVIWGPDRADVKEVLPPKSYIHVEDFYSMQELVDYIQYLDRNDTAYAEYLEWRTWLKYLNKKGEYDPKYTRTMKKTEQPSKTERTLLKTYATMKPVGFCRLCILLHANTECRKTFWRNVGAEERWDCLNDFAGDRIVRGLDRDSRTRV